VQPAEPAKPATEPRLAAQSPSSPDQWISLGSYAPDSPYALLVTLNSRGGAIERIELTERTQGGKLRYRNLEERGGYLGELVLTVAPEGCRVNVVATVRPPRSLSRANPG